MVAASPEHVLGRLIRAPLATCGGELGFCPEMLDHCVNRDSMILPGAFVKSV